MNTRKLLGLIVENGLTQGKVAKAIGIDPSTMWRKMKNDSFTNKEARQIRKLLGLTDEEAGRLFLH